MHDDTSKKENKTPKQQKTKALVRPKPKPKTVALKADVDKILELIRWDAKDEIQCLIKYKGITKPEWVPVELIKKRYPLLLIQYYETRIILRKKQCEMAFESNGQRKSTERKLVVIS